MGLAAGAVSTRVSNELGSGHPYVAQKAVRAGMSVGTCSQACISLLFFTFRHQLGYILTSDTEVVRRTADILPIMCSMIIFDGCNACFSGESSSCNGNHPPPLSNVLKGCGSVSTKVFPELTPLCCKFQLESFHNQKSACWLLVTQNISQFQLTSRVKVG